MLEEMKRCLSTRNFDIIDDAISIRLKPYLYNGGRGRKVSFAEMVLLRNRERSQQKQVRVRKSTTINFELINSNLRMLSGSQVW